MARPKLTEQEKARKEAEREAERERIAAMSADEKREYYAVQRRENFKRVAQRRTQRVLEDLTSLSRVGNRQIYNYTEDEAAKIIAAIDDAFQHVIHSFQPSSGKTEKEVFTL